MDACREVGTVWRLDKPLRMLQEDVDEDARLWRLLLPVSELVVVVEVSILERVELCVA